MKNIVVSGGKKTMVIVGTSNKSNEIKIFCWYGVNENKQFEVGSITAISLEEAKLKLVANKTKGVYSIKEINPNKAFESLGIYTRNN